MDTIAPNFSQATGTASHREAFLLGQGFVLTEDGQTSPVRVLDSNRSSTRSLIAQEIEGRLITRWVSDELIGLASN